MRLVINNSYSKIIGLTPSEEKGLKKELSYTVGGKSAFFSKYGPRRKSLLSKYGEFPTGLLGRVILFIYQSDITKLQIDDNRILHPKRILLSSKWDDMVPYEDQIAAVSAAVVEKRGIISMPTGTGKSLVIAMIVNELKVKTLIVVPSLEIKKQLIASFSSIFNDMSNITVENIDSKNLKSCTDYDCLIIDEAHHAAAKTYQVLNKTAWSNIFYRFFLTATPFRNDPEEELLFESIAGRIIYALSYKDAITKGYIVPMEAYYIELPKKETDAYTYAQVYSELVVNNEDRNAIISTLLLKLEGIDRSTLCLVREVAHGQMLSDITVLPFVSGEDEESRDYIRQFNSDKIRSLIGTTGVIGEGIDTKPCEYVVIAGLGKAKSQLMQQVGRGLRKYPGKESCKIIIFKDRSHKFLIRHFNAQAKILLDEYGVKPVKLDI